MASKFRYVEDVSRAKSMTALEPFKGVGLHAAMYLIPILSSVLTVVLFAASRTIIRDARQS